MLAEISARDEPVNQPEIVGEINPDKWWYVTNGFVLGIVTGALVMILLFLYLN
jgi:hypothetical protein